VPITAICHPIVISMDSEDTIYEDGLVLIEDEHIAYAGDFAPDKVNASMTIVDGSQHIALPGFVNSHTHSSQSLLRGGISHSRRLYDWVVDVLLRGLSQYDVSDYRVATRLYAAEAIRAGITCILTNEEPLTDDPVDGAAAVLDTFAESGLRVAYGLMFRDEVQTGTAEHLPRAAQLPIGDGCRASFDLLDRLHHRFSGTADGRIEIWPSPATTATVSQRAFLQSDSWAEEHGVGWTMHLAEVANERSMRAETPVEYIQAAGALTRRLVGAHGVHITESDITLLANAKAAIATNPVSNSYLASGIAPVPALLAAGVTVGLGTDDANCNDSINPLSDMKYCALLHRAVSMDPAVLSPAQILRMATQGSAEAMGYGSRVGSLEAGKQADVVLVSTNVPQMCPIHDPVAALVFQAYGSEIDTVFIAGRRVLDNGTLTFAPDIDALCAEAQVASSRIIEAAGIPKRPVLVTSSAPS
jgi:cytosine/adenosine deaminase-related metal-dependent hydrolase